MKKFFLLTLILLFTQIITGQEAPGEQTNSNEGYSLWGGFVSIGYGTMTGNMGEYFTGQLLLPLTVDYSYKNLLLQINLDGGYGQISKTITFDDGKQWKDGENVFSNAVGFNAGFSVYQSKSLRVTPFVGYADMYMSKKWWSGSDISEHEPDNKYYNFGLLVDFKNVFDDSSEKYGSYSALRFSIGYYMPAQDDQYPQYYDGSMFYLSLGVSSLGSFDQAFK
jgi:hypothetical protein